MKKLLKNKAILITAGPTREPMDPVRFLSNSSSGFLGIELARVFQNFGAHVTLVLGPTHLEPPSKVKTISISSASQMSAQVKKHLPQMDVFVSAAAVGDWRFENPSNHKLKKGVIKRMRVTLVRNPDILAEAGAWKRKNKIDILLVGFALETKNERREASRKLREKNLDLVISNSPASFSSENIQSTFIDRQGNVKRLPRMSKYRFAHALSKWISNHE